MRMVEVRVLPPQPYLPSRTDGISGIGRFYTDCRAFISRPIRRFQSKAKYQIKGETVMARKAEATVWMPAKIQGRPVMKRMVQKGRGYALEVEGPYEPGSYYVRYTQDGKRIWEDVGNEPRIRVGALHPTTIFGSVDSRRLYADSFT
jgi:hypothetical protein